MTQIEFHSLKFLQMLMNKLEMDFNIITETKHYSNI